MTKLAADAEGHRVQAIRPNLCSTQAVNAAGTVSAAMNGGSRCVVIGSTVDAYIEIGPNPATIDATTGFLFANTMLFVRVKALDKIGMKRIGGSDGVGYIMQDTET